MGNAKTVQQVIKAYYLDEVLVMKRHVSCRDVKSSVA